MSKVSRGDRVIAAKRIGGIWRPEIPKGTRGVVIEGGWTRPARVQFTIEGWLADRIVEVTVEDAEIELIR